MTTELIVMIVLAVLLIVAVVIIFMLRGELNKSLKENKEAQKEAFKNLQDAITKDNELSREMSKNIYDNMQTSITDKLDSFKKNTDEKLESMRNVTNDKLETIRSTVDEKLEKTLTERLGKSFETVGKQLGEVQKGLGEMQSLAQDVGGLKRVLSNVKMRGGLGEVQLGMLLEQILAPDQFAANVHVRPRSQQVVEYAVKLPGKDETADHIWLPIDAKFPRESYERLQMAYEAADPEAVNNERNALYRDIKKMAADIQEKYICPPYTTDFAIMFLPFEGIYSEVVRSASLLQELQNNYKVILTGPTTLAALLNSLQMGFRTLAIQKRSSEVWKVLAGVKKEFSTFGALIAKSKKNIELGLENLNELEGVRTRQIQSKLKKIEETDTDLLEESASIHPNL